MTYYPGGNFTAIFGTFNAPPLLLGPGLPTGYPEPPSPAPPGRCARRTADINEPCDEGLILPTWQPPIASGDVVTTVFRAFVYIIALGYMLFGINVITDRILSAIEVIVSQKRQVHVKSKSGETHMVEVPCWHHVVATLTVYCIGTSTPEIFLPIVDVFKRRFEADELGPAVVVGSGAYHLFLITGVCLASVKEPAGKPIRDLNVFFVTAAYAIFAYLWIWMLVAHISPGVVELWEALMTLALFPAIVFTAWFVERRFPWRYYMRARNFFRCNKQTGMPGEETTQEDIGEVDNGAMLDGIHERRRRLAQLLQHLKVEYPEKTRNELEEMAEMKLLEEMPKDAAFYRIQAGKAISGGGNVISKEKIKEKLREEFQRKISFQVIATDPNTQYVTFDCPRYTCMESCDQTTLTVTRTGPGINETQLTIEYEAFEGTAKFGEDFEPAKGRLTFGPGQTNADIAVTVIDDDEFEDDKEFSVRIYRPVLKASKNVYQSLVVPQPSQSGLESSSQKIEVAPVAEATVCILDDDHCGIFSFESPESAIADNVGIASIKVMRATGARGRVAIPYKVMPGSAKPNDDYRVLEKNYQQSSRYQEHGGILPMVVFENDQFEAFIEIEIIDKNRIGEVATFYIELLEPEVQSSPPKNPLGNPLLGSPKSIKLGICEDAELKEALDRLLKMADISHLVGTTSWRGQFREAITINYHETSDLDSKKLKWFKLSSTYVIFAMSLPWRLLAAALPPTYLLHGWLSFVSLLCVLGFMAALTGDLASAFGCTVGLDDAVTAVTLIAFGMGLPDTFASRHAAMSEKTADAAIGHITGSNAVSVFLGIGVSWTIAASYHLYHNQPFLVPPGSIGLSVTLYCAFATAGISALLLRRLPPIGGELGGPIGVRAVSAVFFICLWFAFVALSILENYCIISGF